MSQDPGDDDDEDNDDDVIRPRVTMRLLAIRTVSV